MSKEEPPPFENPAPPPRCAYAEYLAERDEILRYKWLESEKAGKDITWETALVHWVTCHRQTWLEQRQRPALTS